MISALYSAATAMDAAAVRHEAAAENLANAHLPGYRRRIARQATFNTLVQGPNAPAAASSRLGTTARDAGGPNLSVDFTRGNIKSTSRTLDIALDGEGFFVVDGPDGPLYTRSGAFKANPDGQLVTVDGLPVNSRTRPIEIPPGTSSEAITVTNDGRLFANGAEFGQLETVRFENPNQLTSVGASLFQSADDTLAQPSEEIVLQGFLETSNVANMDELVNIMVASRQYEAAQKALTTISEAIEKHITGR